MTDIIVNPQMSMVQISWLKLLPAAGYRVSLYPTLSLQKRFYLLGRMEDVSRHRLPEAALVLFRTGHRRSVLATASESTILDP